MSASHREILIDRAFKLHRLLSERSQGVTWEQVAGALEIGGASDGGRRSAYRWLTSASLHYPVVSYRDKEGRARYRLLQGAALEEA